MTIREAVVVVIFAVLAYYAYYEGYKRGKKAIDSASSRMLAAAMNKYNKARRLEHAQEILDKAEEETKRAEKRYKQARKILSLKLMEVKNK